MMRSSSSGARKVCFNSSCNQALEVAKHGWICRNGDCADLCDQCASAFKDGKFCDTCHLNDSGWRCCESCGKKVHCGCIVSFHMFILLDAGGIECLKCAKTEYILTPNPTWSSAPHFLRGPPEKIGNIYSKCGISIAGSGPVPWLQAPGLFNAFKKEPELQVISHSLGQSKSHDPFEKFANGSWRVSAQERIGDKACTSGMQYNGKHNVFKDVSYKSFFHTSDTPLSSLPAAFVLRDKKYETGNVSGIHVKRLFTPPSVGTKCSNSNGAHPPPLENYTHNTQARGETWAPHQPLPCYSPQSTDQELQELSGGSNAKITPLFEKVLCASDASKKGRLMLPKKCAEAYLPPISRPEGCPLVIQDLKGKDWTLQYTFWASRKGRKYVLIGVAPCIQSMQLQAGDTVTFSRLEPEGKLVMGFRKVSLASPSDKGNKTTNTRISAQEEFKSRNLDGLWSEFDKISISAKRKTGGTMCSNSKKLKLWEEELFQFSVTLEQVQRLLQPPLTNAPTIVIIEGVELEHFQEAPIIGSPTTLLTENTGSLCSTEVELSPKHPEHTLPMINQDSQKTMEGLDAPADLAVHDVKATTRHVFHKTGCMCNVCLALNRSAPPMMMHHDLTHPQQVGNSMQNPTQLMYTDIICYTQTGNSKSFESTFKNQNIDLNIDPEREEESSPDSDSIGIMRLVQGSTQRYIKQQKISIQKP